MTERDVSKEVIKPSAQRGSRLGRQWRETRQQLVVYGFGAFVFAAALWLTYQFVEPAPPDQLTLATGDPEGVYHRVGLSLQAAFAKEDIRLELVNTQGSVDNIAQLGAGSVDAAFVQSGIADENWRSDIEGLASLYYEPVWLFTYGGERITRLDELAGRRVAIGREGSGTRAVALHLLKDTGLHDDVDTLPMSATEAAGALIRGDIDAAFFITAEDTAIIESLLGSDQVKLADLERSEAHARRNRWLINLNLPSGVFSLEDNKPPVDIRLLSVAATLLVHESLHPALAELLVQSAAVAARRDTLFSEASRFPSPDFLDFPPSREAERYFQHGTPFLQRYLPFWAANLIDRLKVMALPFLALLIPLSRVLPPAYKWTVRKKIYRWYDDVQDIDLSSRESNDADNLRVCVAALKKVENEASTVEVPLSYANELFALRQHIELVEQRLLRQLNV